MQGLNSIKFFQWTCVYPPDPYERFSVYPECLWQLYFASLEEPKTNENQWLWFMFFRLFVPACHWVEFLITLGSSGLSSITLFS